MVTSTSTSDTSILASSDNTEIALYAPLNLKERTHCKSSLLNILYNHIFEKDSGQAVMAFLSRYL